MCVVFFPRWANGLPSVIYCTRLLTKRRYVTRGCWNIRYPSKTRHQLKSREISFAHCSHLGSQTLLIFCLEYDSFLPWSVQNVKTIWQLKVCYDRTICPKIRFAGISYTAAELNSYSVMTERYVQDTFRRDILYCSRTQQLQWLLDLFNRIPPVPHPIMHHFVTETCTCMNVTVTKQGCIVGYLSNAFWDLSDGSTGHELFKCSIDIIGFGYENAISPQGPLLPMWFNFNPSMDK